MGILETEQSRQRWPENQYSLRSRLCQKIKLRWSDPRELHSACNILNGNMYK